MKKTLIVVLVTVVALLICSYFIPNSDIARDDFWKNAIYNENTQLGSGAKTLYIDVICGERKVTFTIKSDKDTVGEALKEHDLIDGDVSEYGIYIKKVNGIRADYEKDGCYWSFNKDGNPQNTGVDFTNFKDRDRFELKVQN